MAQAKRKVRRNQPVQGRLDQRTSSTGSGLPRLLTVQELAEVLRVPVEYVTRRLVFERRIPYIKVGRRTLFDEADIHVFLVTQRVTPED